MWKEESISEAVVRQARCSSRQLVNSALMGKGYAPTGAFLSICTGPPARSMRSSRVLGASVVVDVVVDMVRLRLCAAGLCGWIRRLRPPGGADAGPLDQVARCPVGGLVQRGGVDVDEGAVGLAAA